MLRFALPLALTFSLFGVGAPIVGAQTVSSPDSAAALQKLVDAFDRNDRTAAINMFTDDAIVVGGPCSQAMGGECVGRDQIAQAVNADSDPVNVHLANVQVVGDGNVVTFDSVEYFELPPEATAAGIKRMVETGTAVVQDGKVDRLALVVDLTDPQTVMLQHIFASFTPAPGSAASMTAADGQTLAMQSASTQSIFRALYGDQAAEQWASQHQAALNH